MTYDPEARRDTPLALKLKDRIRREGPLTIAEYMQACLHDSDHGYYVKQPAIGAAGDFITAPEISQVFGELLGLWAAVVWQQMGSPNEVRLVELGPGRGTMMRDLLRAIARVPDFARASHVVLVEPSQRLRAIQRETLAGSPVPIVHADTLESTGSPTLIVANEVLDCIPIDQFVLTGEDWAVRTVELDANGALQFASGPVARPPDGWNLAGARTGDIVEKGRTHLEFDRLGRALAGTPIAALYIDYGHVERARGDTLQAVRGHAHEHPLTSPGEADLTAQVDFSQVTEAATAAGFRVDGPLIQSEFLVRLGLIERASRLMSANPAKAAAIEAGVLRLMAPNGMGTRFKVIGLRSPGLPVLPGFA